ncbi:hypothetical protein ACIQF6_35930 [Kitasatospora sp. NPDC092948]|uniref:hypothetical protein n=1 Tax=Kitasatospora sp. NPDC092948 TaxID=3364088 RepID=UPI00382CB6A0
MPRRSQRQDQDQAAALFDLLPEHVRPVRRAPGPIPEASALLLLATYEPQQERPADRSPSRVGQEWSAMTPSQFGHPQTALQADLFADSGHSAPDAPHGLF